jgi:hypothetical protein
MLSQLFLVSPLFCIFYITLPCHGVFFHSPIFLLIKVIRCVCLNILNITLKLHTCRNMLMLSFFACYSSHLYVHFQMHSLSVEKPLFGENFLFHHCLEMDQSFMS